MIIIALTDIHNNLACLTPIAEKLSTADVVLIAGDITNFGGPAQAEQIISEIRRYNRNILAVPGNCDRPGVADYLSGEGINLELNCITFAGMPFVGLGGSLPCLGSTPNEMPDSDLAIALSALESLLPDDGRFVLVTHEPAVNTSIDFTSGRHIGSDAIRHFIEKNKPVLAVSGHAHEAHGTDSIGPTTLINPGPFKDGRYAYIELTDKVETARLLQIKT
ncbi:MAG: metallophosphoesterase family protein [Planctomycetota bacterium]|jgi:Icc-related predicted phosphoesterase